MCHLLTFSADSNLNEKQIKKTTVGLTKHNHGSSPVFMSPLPLGKGTIVTTRPLVA